MKNQKNNLINQDYLVNSLADFEIICPLGRGAHSFVYEVKSRSQGNHYALKIIDKLKLQEQNLFERLKHEISIQMKLNHPNILKLYHSFEDEDSFYLVLELAKGGELYTYLKSEGKLNEKQSRNLIKQLIDGLIYLHSEKVLHRDLKLSNLLLTQSNQLKIGDFGLAVQLQDHDEEHQTMCGTPNYIPPEIVSRQPYGMTADV